jgi:hypothetical protein
MDDCRPASFSKHLIPAFLTWRAGWHAPARANGTNAPVADPEKFPNGVKDLADQIHGMGLKVHFLTNCRESDVHTSPGQFGIYSSAGKCDMLPP